MGWGNPTAWLLLSAAPLIILLHALRRRRRTVTVTALFLWEEALRARRSRFSLRHLRRNAQFFLQLLALLLLTTALAEPQWRRQTQVSGDLVVVLDTSASMQARGPRGSRFELARREAQRLLAELPDGARMAIITAARRPMLRSFFSADRARLRDLLERLQASDEPGSPRPALLMALNLAQRGQGDEIVLISDGADELPADLDPGRTRIRLLQVSGGERNVGITRFAFRQEPVPAGAAPEGGSPLGSVQLFLEVRNFASTPAQARLTVGFDGRPQHAVELALPARGQQRFVLPVTQPQAREAHAHLEVEDDLAVDNTAHAVLSAAQDTWVLLVGARNEFLRQVFAALPHVLINSVPEVEERNFAQQARGHHLVVFDRVAPPELTVGSFLLIATTPTTLGAAASTAGWKGNGWIERPTLGGWATDHPLLRLVNLDGLRLARTLRLQVPQGAALASDGQGRPLIGAYDDGSLRLVLLGFDLLESDFPLRVAFPIFISNLVRWVHPGSLRFSAKMVQAGEAAVLAVPPRATQLRLLRPDGARLTLPVHDQLTLRYEATDRVGIYRWQGGNELRAFAVNLLDPRESDIATRDHPAWSAPRLHAGVVQTTTQAYWRLPLLLGLLVLGVEWWLWRREG